MCVGAREGGGAGVLPQVGAAVEHGALGVRVQHKEPVVWGCCKAHVFTTTRFCKSPFSPAPHRYKLPARPAGPYSLSLPPHPGSNGISPYHPHGLPHAFFDTFPLNEDPVEEAELNVVAFRAMWARAGRLRRAGMEGCLAARDALCSMRLLAAVG